MTRRVARPEFVPPLCKASEERPGGVISFLINGPAILANANLRPLPKVAGFFAYWRAHRSARSKHNGQPPSLRLLRRGSSPPQCGIRFDEVRKFQGIPVLDMFTRPG